MYRGHIRLCRGTSFGSPMRPRGRASPLSESSAAECTVWSVSSTAWRAAHEMAYLFDDPILLDGSLYRSLTGSPHPATPYEEGVRRTLEWFRSHRTRA